MSKLEMCDGAMAAILWDDGYTYPVFVYQVKTRKAEVMYAVEGEECFEVYSIAKNVPNWIRCERIPGGSMANAEASARATLAKWRADGIEIEEPECWKNFMSNWANCVMGGRK